MDVQNYYKILGVKRNATQLIIETTYEGSRARHEAGLITPDEWALIHEAYQILSDPEHRMLYDEVLKQDNIQPPPAPAEPESTESAPAPQKPNLYDSYRRKQEQDPSSTPAWLADYRKKQESADQPAVNKTGRKTPSPQRVSITPQSTTTTKPKLEAPSARYQPRPTRPSQSKSGGSAFVTRFGIRLAIFVAVIIARFALGGGSDSDDNQNNYTFPTYSYRYSTTDYSSRYSSDRTSFSVTLTAIANWNTSILGGSGSSSNSGFVYATRTPTRVRTGPSNTPPPRVTRTSTLERCQVTNTSPEPVAIYQEMALDSLQVGSFEVAKILFTYRDKTEPDWLRIAEEQGVDVHLEVDNESVSIGDTYIYADDVKIDFCINSN